VRLLDVRSASSCEMEEASNPLPVTLPVAATTLAAVLCSALAIVLANVIRNRRRRSSAGNSDSDEDPYRIARCPNPNCARCRRYEELNRSAKRRLPWVAPANPNSLARIRDAVSLGSKSIDEDGRGDGAAPVPGQRPTVLLVRGLEARPIVTAMHESACRIFDRVGTRDRILSEYTAAMGSNAASPLENDVSSGSWQVLHFLNQGRWVEENATLCSTTAGIIKNITGMMDGTVFGNAFVSTMNPGTHIDLHCGPSNVRHRLHFCLQAPKGVAAGRPKLRVANKEVTWSEGVSFVFDDSIVHSATYSPCEEDRGSVDSASLLRIVLIIDLWHPSLSDEERRAVADLYPS